MTESLVGETNPNERVNINEDATNPTTDDVPTQTNLIGAATTRTFELKKRKTMSSRFDVWDHFIKWDQETDYIRGERDELIDEDEY